MCRTLQQTAPEQEKAYASSTNTTLQQPAAKRGPQVCWLLNWNVSSTQRSTASRLPSAVGGRPLFGEASALEPMLGPINQGFPTVLLSLHVNKHNPFVGPVLHTISHCLCGKRILLYKIADVNGLNQRGPVNVTVRPSLLWFFFQICAGVKVQLVSIQCAIQWAAWLPAQWAARGVSELWIASLYDKSNWHQSSPSLLFLHLLFFFSRPDSPHTQTFWPLLPHWVWFTPQPVRQWVDGSCVILCKV